MRMNSFFLCNQMFTKQCLFFTTVMMQFCHFQEQTNKLSVSDILLINTLCIKQSNDIEVKLILSSVSPTDK